MNQTHLLVQFDDGRFERCMSVIREFWNILNYEYICWTYEYRRFKENEPYENESHCLRLCNKVMVIRLSL